MEYLIEVMPQLLVGALTTLKLFLFTLIGSLPLGIILALGLSLHFKPLRYLLHICMDHAGNATIVTADFCFLWFADDWDRF